ncbi:SGNH/GDSL hydrolase family protein [Lacticaseibacillus zeae]|uniref:SGNH/GDSL hydrolase family protein n=1 Tax=Lacticaseibacillus zeae subsp. silagei TaxID=3068307 RepID=A0ABD7ZCY9_LACZE|nr:MULTISPECIES: SGNH/GDSL hydrolase family protein [Lacticaseibacillus]MDE3315128.1 SGNH/GDSL hydrolase family protein [Lacticaseibacillus zeae]OFR95356.1 lipase [Lactobacillus sp. HMSC068F07]WLV84907.1 SGNH/GDSL hydrolase family protein [Lacticaseibacillus sp. NCIMB 15475]WLV85302.1 SGNH/GDSL hydrolase family protein [Lacticaseibacillus sp. NCIMB 15474]
MAKLKNIFIACSVVLIACLLAFGGWQLFGPATDPSEVKVASSTPKQIQLTAVGDSLTYGVGDATNNGGYVGLTKSDLEATGQYQVTTKNYGVSGDTSTQILNRINKQAKIRTDLKRANIITVTAGGNDLMHVLQKHFLTLSEKQITAGSAAFQKRLTTLLTTIRKENPSAPIYVFGIYNPFYVYFPKMTAMTNSVTAWNQATQKTLQQFKHVYYVDIDSVLSSGDTAANKASAKEALKEATSGEGNPLIFSQDHFHPNNAGYAQMTKQLMKQIQATKKEWE